jgi:peptide/nickel transport system permease protein
MRVYVFRRLVSLVPVLLIVAFVAFSLMQLVPGDPASVLLGPDAPDHEVEALRVRLGFDQPLLVQFGLWFGRLLQGDLGTSYYLGLGVAESIATRVPATLYLALSSLLVAVTFGMPLGIVAAVRHKSWIDRLVMLFAMVGIAAPSFWIGLNFILVFSVWLRWFPTGGYVPLSEDFLGGLRYLVLPALALGLNQAALIARMTRSSVLDVLRQDYVRTARSKGVSERSIIWRHILKNAMNPVLTIIGISFGVLMSGTVIVETVFTYPGLGRLVVLAVQRRDYPLVQGILLLAALLYMLINLLVDLAYALFDPRIHYE